MKPTFLVNNQTIESIELINGKWQIKPDIENWKQNFYIKCDDCNTIVKRNFTSGLAKKKFFFCQVCCKKGERNPFFGKKHSEKTKGVQSLKKKGKYFGDKNPMYGKTVKNVRIKKFGIEIAEKLEKERLQKISIKNSGSNNFFYGKKHSQDIIDIIRKKNIDYQNSLSKEKRKEISEKFSKLQKDLLEKDPIDYIKKRKKANAISLKSQNRYKMNKIEKKVYEWFKEKNISVKYSIILGNYQFDFGVKEKRILIEINGNYWHGNELLYNETGLNGKIKLNETQKQKKLNDIKKKQFAIDHNFKYYVIWETDILNENYKQILEEIWTSN